MKTLSKIVNNQTGALGWILLCAVGISRAGIARAVPGSRLYLN